MKKFTLFITIGLLLCLTTIKGQDTISSCVYGTSNSGSGVTMLTEYLDGDSIFVTAWDANGSIWVPRLFNGYYYVSHDTVTFISDSAYCGTTPGVYTFEFDTTSARDRWIVTKVNDPCAGRVQWQTAFNNIYPCYEKPQPIVNTCFASFNKFTGDYIIRHFSANNEVYETGYNHVGTIISARQQKGWYYNNYDTIIFVEPSSSTCGSDSGVYTFFFVNDDEIILQKVNDPCTSRVTINTGSNDHFVCKSKPIGIVENDLEEASYRIYPNPTSNTITIEQLNKVFDKNTKIVLYDILGNKLTEKIIGKSDTYTLQVANVPAGIYILQVITHNEEVHTERIVIRH